MGRLTEQQQRELDDAVREWQGRFAPRHGYPVARKRITLDTKAGFKVVAPAIPSPQVPFGGIFDVTFQVNAGATLGEASAAINTPCSLYYFRIQSESALTEDIRFRILIAADNNVAAGFSSSGVGIDLGVGSGSGIFTIRGFVHEGYPNTPIRAIPSFIKFVVFNNTAAARFVHGAFSLRSLP